MPKIATFSVGWMWATLTALYVVTPAQVERRGVAGLDARRAR